MCATAGAAGRAPRLWTAPRPAGGLWTARLTGPGARRVMGGMTDPFAEFPRDRHGLIRRSRALDLGISDERLAAAVRHGELLRLTPGAFAVPPPHDPAAPW